VGAPVAAQVVPSTLSAVGTHETGPPGLPFRRVSIPSIIRDFSNSYQDRNNRLILGFGGKSMALKSMSVERLRDLKGQVEAAINAKITARRHELESELSKLARVDGRRANINSGRGGPRGAVAPKYRNPNNPAETWAGRGLRPRWMAAALKSGRKIDDFLIAGASTTKQPKKIRKMRRASK
jgi:DNA-binding protein H-NS